MTVIEAIDVTKRYGRLRAVDQVNITVESGQIYGILGPNGSGKTTLIGMMLDILRPTAGRIRLFEQYEGPTLQRGLTRVGATIEAPNFYPYLSGYENLRIAARIKRVDRKAIDRALEEVGLADRARDRFRTYSLGMKQRLAIASALLGAPELVILDEPTNGLDPEGIREIRDLIHRLRDQGRTIFVSSHLLNEIERTCTHVAVLKRGRILQSGSLVELISAHPVALVKASDLESLRNLLGEYPGALSASLSDGGVLVELNDPDTAVLNRWLVERNVFVSHLSLKKQTLEEVFMDLTSEPAVAA